MHLSKQAYMSDFTGSKLPVAQRVVLTGETAEVAVSGQIQGTRLCGNSQSCKVGTVRHLAQNRTNHDSILHQPRQGVVAPRQVSKRGSVGTLRS